MLGLIGSMLVYIRELIRYSRCTTGELIETLKGDSRYSAAFSEDTLSLLLPAEREALGEMFSRLGTTDAEGHEAMLTLYISRFAGCEAEAKQKERSQCRLYEVLGFMAGAFVAVLIV